MSDQQNHNLFDSMIDRRGVLARVLGTGLGMTALGTLGSAKGLAYGASANLAVNDADVLNFALNLEYLEAEYYLRGLTGSGLSDVDTTGSMVTQTGRSVFVTGGKKVNFKTPALQNYVEELAMDEKAHVKFLRGALKGAAVDRPAIDFTSAFNAAAKAAGIGDKFDPFADEMSFMIGAFVFEDVGVTAYLGGAGLLKEAGNISAAAAIMAAEAYHAGMVRTVLYNAGGMAHDAAKAISDLRDKADGGADKDQPLEWNGKANIAPLDRNGLAFARTVSEVLSIVYLGGRGSGGFFPAGLNGNVK